MNNTDIDRSTWEDGNNLFLFDDNVSDCQTLEDNWNNFVSNMTIDQQRKADDESIRLYGKTNMERYKEKAKELSQTIDTDDISLDEASRVRKKRIITPKDKDISNAYAHPFSDDIETKIEAAKKYMSDMNTVIMYPVKTLEELESLWNRMMSTVPTDQIVINDTKVQELFGYTNIELYAKEKQRLTDRVDDIIKTSQQPDSENVAHTVDINNRINARKVHKAITNYVQKTAELDNADVSSVVIQNEAIKEVSEEIKSITEYTPAAALNPVIGMVGRPMPIYSPYEIDRYAMNDDIQKNLYHTETPNKEKAKKFRDTFDSIFRGEILEDFNGFLSEWINEVQTALACSKNTPEDRQYIVALGWHPDYDIMDQSIDWNDYAKKFTEKISEEYNYYNTKIYNLCEFTGSDDVGGDGSIALKSIGSIGVEERRLNPVYIVLSTHDQLHSKVIRKFTNGPFSHAQISFDLDMNNLLSFNMKKEVNGLAHEKFSSMQDSTACIYAIFLNDEEYEKIKNFCQFYVDNVDKTHYSWINIFTQAIKLPLNFQYDMVCSQFVDAVLKFANIDLTKKDSSIVSPNDFYRAAKVNKRMYKIFDGKVNDYKPTKMKMVVSRLIHSRSTKSINEMLTEFVGLLSINEDNGAKLILNIKNRILDSFVALETEIVDTYYSNDEYPEIVKEEDRMDNNLSTPEELYKYMTKEFKYGLVNNGTVIKHPHKEDYEKFKAERPEQFEKYKVGLCYDFAAYGYTYFKQNFKNLQPKGYYLEADTGGSIRFTHAWMAYTDNGKLYVFDTCWIIGSHKRIWEASSEQDMINTYLKDAKTTYKDQFKCAVFAYDPTKVYGKTESEIIEYVWKNGNTVYNPDKLEYDKNAMISESVISENKEFPVQFDKDGNLLIKNYKKLDYNQEYQLSHIALKTYYKSNNIEAIKYELARLWFLNSVLMVKIRDDKTPDTEKAQYEKIRAWVMNDFTSYHKKLIYMEPGFNFSKYYENSPFSDVKIQINHSTITGVTGMLSDLLKAVMVK